MLANSVALSPNIDVIKHVCGYENFLPSLNMFNTSFGNGKTFLLYTNKHCLGVSLYFRCFILNIT